MAWVDAGAAGSVGGTPDRCADDAGCAYVLHRPRGFPAEVGQGWDVVSVLKVDVECASCDTWVLE